MNAHTVNSIEGHMASAPVFAVLLLAAMTFGCGDSSDVDDWEVTVSPSSFAVAAGDSVDISIMAETNTTSGNVDLSLYQPPPFDTPVDAAVAILRGCSFLELSQGTPSSCLARVVVPSTAVPGEYEMVVRGAFNMPDAIDNSNLIFLTVTPGPAPFDLAVAGDTEVANGSSVSLAVSLTRDSGFDGPVDLSVRRADDPSLPFGLTAFFDPDPIPEGETSSTLTITSDGAKEGPLELLIEGTSPLGSVASVSYDLEVTPATGWRVVRQQGGVKDLDFPSPAAGYVVGTGPTVLKSTDGGESWESISFTATGPAERVQFLDDANGFVCGGGSIPNGFLMKTTDGGAGWTNVVSNMPVPLGPVRAIHFLDATHGFAAGDTGFNLGTVLYTDDGGASWTEIEGPWTISGGTISHLEFSSEDTGYVVWSAGTRFTADGGATWEASSGATRPYTDTLGSLAVAGDDQVFRSLDGGASWSSEVVSGPEGATFVRLQGVSSFAGTTWIAGAATIAPETDIRAYVAHREGGGWVTQWLETFGPGNPVNEIFDLEIFGDTEGVAISNRHILRRIP